MRPSRAARMRDVLTHRGPDEAGLHCDAHAALAHRRLSIVDLSTGQQPLSNEDGSVWVVFNGEIYNHADDPQGARSARPPLPDEVGHRDDRPRLRAVGRRLRPPVPRHVRVRDLGRAEAPAAARARSARRQAALLGRARATTLLFGSEIKAHPRERPDRAAAERRGAARSAQHALHRPARRRCSAASTSCCPATCWSSKTARSRRGSTGTSRSRRRAQAQGSGRTRRTALSPQPSALSSRDSARCSRNRSASG